MLLNMFTYSQIKCMLRYNLNNIKIESSRMLNSLITNEIITCTLKILEKYLKNNYLNKS